MLSNGSRVLQKPSAKRLQSPDEATTSRPTSITDDAAPQRMSSKRFPSLLSRNSTSGNRLLTNHSRSSSSASLPRSTSGKLNDPVERNGMKLSSGPSSSPRGINGASTKIASMIPRSASTTTAASNSSRLATATASSPSSTPSRIPTLSTQDVSVANSRTGGIQSDAQVPVPSQRAEMSGIPRMRQASDPSSRMIDRSDSAQLSQPPSIGDNQSDVLAVTPHENTTEEKPYSLLRNDADIQGGLAEATRPVADSATISTPAVPTMWRSTSYDGAAKAALQQSSTADTGRSRLVGLSGLRKLEESYLWDQADSAITDLIIQNAEPDTIIKMRIRMMRQLVHISGEEVLADCDIARTVWLDGVNLRVNAGEEMAQTRNGSITAPAKCPAPDRNDELTAIPTRPLDLQEHGRKVSVTSTTSSSFRKPSLFDRVAARLGGGHVSAQLTKQFANTEVSHQKDSAAAAGRKTIEVSTSRQPTSTNESADSQMVGTRRVFGSRLDDIPHLAYAVSIIGGQRHQLPVVVFSLIESIFRRGLSDSRLFRRSGDPDSLQRLKLAFDTSPTYGDNIDLKNEDIATLCDLLQVFLHEMPEPIFSEELWPLFKRACLTSLHVTNLPQQRANGLASAQIILRLLPRKNLSMFIYMVAFLYQLTLHPLTALDTSVVACLFAPSMLGSCRGMDGQAEAGLAWLLTNWDDSLSQDLLDEDYNCLNDVHPDLIPRLAAVSSDEASHPPHERSTAANFSATSATIPVEKPTLSKNIGESAEAAVNGNVDAQPAQPAYQQQPISVGAGRSFSAPGLGADIGTETSTEHMDADAAHLFGSLGELYQNQKRQLDLRNITIASLEDIVRNHQIRHSELETETTRMHQRANELDRLVVSQATQAKKDAERIEELLASLEKLERTLDHSQRSHNERETAFGEEKKAILDAHALDRASLIASFQQEQQHRSNSFAAETGELKRQIQSMRKDLDHYIGQIDGIKSLLSRAPDYC